MNQKASGFSLIELLIAMAITAILFSVGVQQFLEFNKVQSAKGVGQTVKNNLRNIQSLALAGNKPVTPECSTVNALDGYRVVFTNATTYTAQAVCAGTTSGSVRTYTLTDGFTFSGMSFPTQFTFLVLGKGATTNQVITVRGYTSPYFYYRMCVSQGGDIKDCGYTKTNPPSCTCP